jgi:protein-S-isoprenylcysteine O-methyltransferase Ste14
MMSRVATFLYGLVCYAIFGFAFLYAIGFTGNLAVPKSIDSGAESGLAVSLAINLILLGLFAIQHTVMARPGFKASWTKIVPVPADPAGSALLVGLFWLGWFTVLFSTFIVDHFDLFGLRQVWYYLRGQEYHHIEFQTKSLYRHIRHPIMAGFIIAFWATPQMTAGHLLFAAATTAYILIGIQFEEHDLKGYFGKDYDHYRRTVPMLIPFLRKRSAEPPRQEEPEQKGRRS